MQFDHRGVLQPDVSRGWSAALYLGWGGNALAFWLRTGSLLVMSALIFVVFSSHRYRERMLRRYRNRG
jgi:uncharacterized membrane protein